jgi:hypothetical protein
MPNYDRQQISRRLMIDTIDRALLAGICDVAARPGEILSVSDSKQRSLQPCIVVYTFRPNVLPGHVR